MTENGSAEAVKAPNATKQKKSTSKKKPAKKVADKKTAKTSQPQWNFPKYTLEEAIFVAQAIYEKHGGNPLTADTLASYLGRSNDWRFQELLRAANLYGLVSGSGARATVHLEKLGEGIVAPSSPGDRQNALLGAFNNVDLFKRVAEFYSKGARLPDRLPEDEYFGNTLVRDFQVPRDRVDVFIKVFGDNLTYVKSFGVGRTALEATNGVAAHVSQPEKPIDAEDSEREFIDTCFVLMPFGVWYDRYWEEVYRPAIKEAGMEPRRADSVFVSGSVMEHIWEEILKAKVLVADLTGRNPNVFYELGLSHAVGKAVVFVAADLEDVPFDLRHLRVIVYDIRDPWWGEKLRKGITEYIKNARKEPAKSIPQPFRDIETAALVAARSDNP